MNDNGMNADGGDAGRQTGNPEITGTDAGPATGMTLEHIIDHTGELEHLNVLVMKHIGRSGGFTDTRAYFVIVTPLLDRLEVEIRTACRPGMDRETMKGIIGAWIDREIALVD